MGCVVVCVALLCAGCVNPSSRARERAAALRRLSRADQQSVLSGHIPRGADRDAVYIAWGAPSHALTRDVRGRHFELWLYTHVEYGVTSGYFGVTRGFAYPGGSDDHGRYVRAGYADSHDDFYVAPIYDRGLPPPETEVPYRKAVFEHGRVIDAEPVNSGH